MTFLKKGFTIFLLLALLLSTAACGTTEASQLDEQVSEQT